MKHATRYTVAIVGGGIAGLSTAWYLQQRGIDYVLLERDGRWGGSEFRLMEFERYEVMIEQKQAITQQARVRALPTEVLLASADKRSLGELVGRFGTPLVALLLALMAIPLSFVNPRAGRANNMLVALLVYLLYSNAISVFQSWVSQGKLGFVAGLVLPHLVVLVALGLMFYKRLAVSPFWRRRT